MLWMRTVSFYKDKTFRAICYNVIDTAHFHIIQAIMQKIVFAGM